MIFAVGSMADDKSECKLRLEDFVHDLDSMFNAEPPSLIPVLDLLKKYFPVKGCDIPEALNICRQSRYLDVVADQGEAFLVTFASSRAPHSGYFIQFSLVKGSADSRLPFAKVKM